MLVRQDRGLIVTTTFWDRDRYLRGNLYYDLAKAAMNRLAFGMAQELRAARRGLARACRPAGCAPSSCWPGHKTDESHWQERPALARTESPRYLGPRRRRAGRRSEGAGRRAARCTRVADLAREYGFTDIDGRQVPAFELDA